MYRSFRLDSMLAVLLALVGINGCGGQSSGDGGNDVGGTPPDPCDGCYVVNASISAVSSRNVFVAGYEDLNQPLLRSFDGTNWHVLLEEGPPGTSFREIAATEKTVFIASDEALLGYDIAASTVEPLDVVARHVWALADDVFVGNDDGVFRFDGNTWNPEIFDLSGQSLVGFVGRAVDGLLAVGVSGALSRHENGGWVSIPITGSPWTTTGTAINDAWMDSDGTAYAVSGSDNPDGTTGPGLIGQFDGNEWVALQEVPRDALLAVASAGPLRVFAVGATRDADGNARAVVWKWDGDHWARHVLSVDAFLWDAWCGEGGPCYAAGTDNTFLKLDEL